MSTAGLASSERAGLPAPVWLLAVGAFAIGTDTFVVAGVLPAVAADLRVSLTAAGQVISVFALAFGVLAPVLAATTARVPRRRLQIAALVVFGAGNLASALAPSLLVLLGTRLLAAGGAAAYTPAAAASAATLVGSAQRGRALALVLGGTTVATVVGVPVVALAGNSISWRVAFAVVGALGLVLAVALLVRLPQLPMPPVASLRERVEVLAEKRVLLVVLVTALFSVGGFMVYSYVTVPLLAVGADASTVSLLLGVFGVGGVLGNWLGGRLTDRFGPEWVLLGGLGTYVLSLLAFSLAERGLAWAAVSMLVWSASAWSLTVPQQHRLMRYAPQAPAVAIGLNSAAMFVGLGVAGAIGGLVLPSGTARLALVGTAVVAIALLLAGGQIWTERRGRGQSGDQSSRPPALGAAEVDAHDGRRRAPNR